MEMLFVEIVLYHLIYINNDFHKSLYARNVINIVNFLNMKASVNIYLQKIVP